MKKTQLVTHTEQIRHGHFVTIRLSRSGGRNTNAQDPSGCNDSPNVSVNRTPRLKSDPNLLAFDLIPNQQEAFKPQKKINSPRAHRVLPIIINFVILLVMAKYSIRYLYEDHEAMKNGNNSIAGCKQNNFEPTYSLNRLIGINKEIRYLHKKLKNLNKTLEETLTWRDAVKLDVKRIENEHSKYLKIITLEIERALSLYDADKIGIIDYALESAGAYITSIPDTTPLPAQFSYDFMSFITVQNPSNPRLLIQPGTLPGHCFAFVGSIGRIRIRLAFSVNITAVTMEHTYPNLVEDMSSAPKDFKVYGLEKGDAQTGDELGDFTYKLNGKALQMFKVKSKMSYQHVELLILTNQGNVDYTCVYRFRVHGNSV